MHSSCNLSHVIVSVSGLLSHLIAIQRKTYLMFWSVLLHDENICLGNIF